MKTAKLVSAALCLTLALAGASLSGCSGSTKAGTKYTQLPDRSLQAIFSGDLATVHNRAANVLKDDFEFTVTKDKKDALAGIIEAKTAKDEIVTVSTFKEGENTTKVRVNAGFLKSANTAEQILSKIEASLPGSK
jgi:hypothetical protein